MFILTQVAGCIHTSPTRVHSKLWKLRGEENYVCLSEVFNAYKTEQYAVIDKHSRFDFAEGQTFACFRAGVEFFLKSQLLDEEMKKTFG